MQVPYVSDIEIDALKRLNRDERDDLKRRIIAAHPNDLFGTAKPSNDPDAAYIICPNCGNGSGQDRTPVKCSFKGDRWLYHCFARNDLEGDLLNLIADEEHLNLSNADDMAKALTIGASMIGYNIDCSATDRKKFLPRGNSKSHEKETKPVVEIFKRLAESQENLHSLFDVQKDYRGLTQETLDKLNWGFLPDYKHPKNEYIFSAVIIPNDKGGILARAIEDKSKSNITPMGTTTICLPTDNNILFVVEGAIDAASIAQATNFQYGVIAIGGTSGIKNCVARLKELSLGKPDMFKIIVMLDHDSDAPDKDSGQVAAKKLVAELDQRGFAVVNKVICEEPRRDPNLILQEEGDEALHNRIENIVADAQKQFDEIQSSPARAEIVSKTDKLSTNKNSSRREEEFSQLAQIDSPVKHKEIIEWEQVNGVINSDILADLFAFADKVKDVKDYATAAADTSSIKKLGYCRYYPFAHVAQKFFVELRAAVDKAKSKVKAWSKHIADTDKYNAANIGARRELDLSKKPTDADFTLATINPRLVSEEVDKYAKKAKREHEKWLVQHRCDEINAKREAERAEYEDAPPTTQQFVPNCPIDLILPEGSTFNDDGIKYVDWDKPAKDGRPRVEICHNPIVPVKQFLSEIGHISYETAIKCNGRWVYYTFDARTLTEGRSVFELANCGLKIAEPRLLGKFISKLLSINEKNHNLPIQKIFTRSGWREVAGEKIFLDPRRLPDGVQIEEGELTRHLKAKGSLDEWKRAYSLVKKSPIARAVVAAAFVPTLLDVIGERGFMIFVKGMTRGGKTTALMLAASAIGDTGLMRSFDSTRQGLLAVAAEHCDYPLIVDEWQAADKKLQEQMQTLVYCLTNGVGRSRADKTGKARAVEQWRTVVIGTGEVPFRPDNAPEGFDTRTLILSAPDVMLPPEDCATIREILPDNHGLAAPLFLDKVKELTRETIKAEYRELRSVLKADYPDILDDHRRYVAALTISDGILNCALGADFDEAKADALENLALKLFPIIPTACELSLFDRYKEFVLGIVGKNQGRFKKGVGYDAIKPPQETWGIIRDDDGYTHILADVFKEQCERAKLDYRKVESVLVEGKFFIPDKNIEEGHKTPRKTKRKLIGKVRLYCYRFRNEELGDE